MYRPGNARHGLQQSRLPTIIFLPQRQKSSFRRAAASPGAISKKGGKSVLLHLIPSLPSLAYGTHSTQAQLAEGMELYLCNRLTGYAE